MIIVDGTPLETNQNTTQEFKILDAAAKLLFKLGIADFVVKLKSAGQMSDLPLFFAR